MDVSIDRRAFLHRSLFAGVGVLGLPRGAWSVDRDVLRIRSYVDLSSLDPAMLLSVSTGLLTGALYRNLVRYRPGSWDWELDAAESFEQLDPVRYAFRLRRGIAFDGGGEMTADDVKFSLERVIDPELASPNAGDLGTLDRVEVHDRLSGTLVLESPFAAFVPIGLCASTGAILSRRAVEAAGGSFGHTAPGCSGPYRLQRWEPQRVTVLERNPAWSGPRAPFRQIHVHPISDIKAAELAYEAGELDCTQTAVESVEVFRRRMPADSRLEVEDSLRYYWVGLNRDHPRLRDLGVRRAVQWGIDVEAVLEAAWFGLAEPATGIIAPSLVGHRERADIPPAGDREKARELLREAGVELPLRLTMAVKSDPLEMTAAQVVQWSLGKIGIELELQPQDNATLLTLGMESAGDRWKDLQLHLQSFAMLGDPYYATSWFVSEQVGVWNWERFRSEEFDRLHREALRETDPARRGPLYRRMQDLMEASGCYRFLTHGVEPLLTRTWLEPAVRADGYPYYRDFALARPDGV